ncbi:MAG: glutathione S-transferase family protein [Proteobacteria bacterium]|nr:glutathione S-transferase family protein [Pseudomonadota bacterium]
MIELYTAATSNGLRPAIMLAECGLEHRLHKIDLASGEQGKPDFLALNPLAQIPVIVDEDDGERVVLSESTAILLYLAEKSGFGLPESAKARARTLEALANVMTDVYAPFNGLFHLSHPGVAADKTVSAVFDASLERALGHWDLRLVEAPWLAGDYSIADIALYPTLLRLEKPLGRRYPGLANLKRWAGTMAGRPGVGRALAAAGWS